MRLKEAQSGTDNHSADRQHFGTSADSIDVWWVDLSNKAIDDYRSLLSDDEQKRASKFLRESTRDNFARSRCALRLLLTRYLSEHNVTSTTTAAEAITPNTLTFRYGERGKPALAEPQVEGFSFNLSHSESIALIAVTQHRQVGIDINHLNRVMEWLPVAKRSFSSVELARLQQMPTEAQRQVFHGIWVQKEAYTKAIGEGYAYGFQQFSVAADGTFGLISDENNVAACNDWQIQALPTGSAYIAAIAFSGSTEVSIQQRSFYSEFSFHENRQRTFNDGTPGKQP